MLVNGVQGKAKKIGIEDTTVVGGGWRTRPGSKWGEGRYALNCKEGRYTYQRNGLL